MADDKTNDSSVTTAPGQEPNSDPDADFKTAKRAGKDCISPESAPTPNDGLSREAALTALTVEEERKLLRKVDWRLIPLMCMLYLVKKLDETNVRVL